MVKATRQSNMAKVTRQKEALGKSWIGLDFDLIGHSTQPQYATEIASKAKQTC